MARFPTAATIKYEANAPGMISGLADILRRCGKEVIVQCPLEQYAPGLVDWYGMQWMGTSAYNSFGDRVPTWFRMLHEGKWNEAMELYWSYQPGREAKGAFHASFNGANLIHRPGWKYLVLAAWLQWRACSGCRRCGSIQTRCGNSVWVLANSGFKLPENDDGFLEGRFVVEHDASLARDAAE